MIFQSQKLFFKRLYRMVSFCMTKALIHGFGVLLRKSSVRCAANVFNISPNE